MNTDAFHVAKIAKRRMPDERASSPVKQPAMILGRDA